MNLFVIQVEKNIPSGPKLLDGVFLLAQLLLFLVICSTIVLILTILEAHLRFVL